MIDKIKNNWEKFGFILLFLLSTILVVYKCHIGMSWWDESFYLSVPYRLVQGDSMLVEEWHLSQLSGIILYPLVKLWLAVTHSMDGIILAGRYFCIFIEALVSIFIYIRLRQWNKSAAIVCAIAYYLYIPYGIMQLSYNSMGLIFMVTSVVIVATMQQKKELQSFIAGILFACAVLCCPLLILVYIYAWGYFFYKKNGRTFASWNAGIIAMVIVFFSFVLSRTSVQKIIESIPYIMADPEHNFHYTVWDYIKQYVSFIFNHNAKTPFIYMAYIVICVAICIDRRRYEHRKVFYPLILVCIGVLFTQILYPYYQINYLMFPLAIGGFPIYLLYRNRIQILNKIMYCMWIPGLLFSFGISVTSNLAFAAIASAATVMSLATICMILVTIHEEQNRTEFWFKITYVAIVLCMMLYLLCLFALRYRTVQWEEAPWKARVEIQDGCQKGLYAPQYGYDQYYAYREATAELRSLDKDAKVLYISNCMWLYLDTTARSATSTTWLISIDQLYDYYKVNPQKKPDMVFVDKDKADMTVVNDLCAYLDFEAQENAMGYILK